MSGVWIWYIISLWLTGCPSAPNGSAIPEPEAELFIYLSHTRLANNQQIYDKVYQIDFSKYKYTLLGGDMAEKSFGEEKIIRHLDSIFDLKNQSTLWSIGNHDRASDKTFYKHTLKHKYGLYQYKDVSFFVLDSQDSLSSIVGKQREFFAKALDTITSKKIVVLTHKLIFMDQHPVMDSLINKVCNGKKGDCFYCHNRNNFQEEIYPKLVELRRNKKQVIWIGGDLGKKTSRFEYIDDAGIVFLGNGVWFEKPDNEVLLLRNTSEKLEYGFVAFDTLVKYQEPDALQNLFSAK